MADTVNDTIERVSLFDPVVGQVAAASYPTISDDGRFIAYEGGAYTGLDRPATPSGISGIYLYDRQEETTTVVSGVGFGVPTALSFDADVAPEGGSVVFSSEEDALVGADTNEVSDVFRFSVGFGTVTRLSAGSGGGQSTVASTTPRTAYTGSGIYAYQRGDDVVVLREEGESGTAHVIEDRQLVDLSPRGFSVTYTDDDQLFYEWSVIDDDDIVTIGTGLGAPANGAIVGGALDYYGTRVVFASGADNLVVDDDNETDDAFVRLPLESWFES